MTGVEEELITNGKLLRSGDAVNQLLCNCLVQLGENSNVTVKDVLDLLAGDRLFSLIRAYTLIGYIPGFDTAFIEINKRLRAMHPNIIKQITDDIIDLGGDIMQDDSTGLIEINREFTASLVIARCKQTDAGSNRWNIQFDNSLRPDMTIAARMDSDNNSFLDYYLLPATELAGEKLRLAETNGLYYDAFRFDSLDYLYYLARRASILEVANYGIRS
jgi:hypothetical protein